MRDELERLKKEYAAQIPTKVEEIDRLVNEIVADLRDGRQAPWKGLEEIAHKLAGSSGIYGFKGVSAAARHVEELIGTGRLQTAAKTAATDHLMRWKNELSRLARIAVGGTDSDFVRPADAFAVESTSTSESMRILLAEDDPSVQAIALMALTKVGKHSVRTAVNGREVLQIVAAEAFDLILLDVMMPDIDGFETCSRLKADPQTKGIPVIFLTAKAQAYEIQHGISVGAIGYILKPFDPMTLHKQIEEVLRGHEQAA